MKTGWLQAVRRTLGAEVVVPNSSPADARRWVLVDVESSGLDYRRANLLAIAALAITTSADAMPTVELSDSFEVVLKQSAPSSPENILVHGIGALEQARGVPEEQAMQAFCEFVKDAPLLAFHAVFDRTLIERTLRKSKLPLLGNAWLDLEPLCFALFPNVRARALDDWLDHFDIECLARHQAAADTLATAELLMRLWPKLAAQHPTDWPAVQKLAEQARWLRRQGQAF